MQIGGIVLETIKSFVEFLEMLDKRNIYYKLSKIRDSIMVEVAVPGQRWEIEFMSNGSIEIEKFLSDGEIYGYSEIKKMFEDFSE